MVLYTIIGEYDVLYAQERELNGFLPDKPSEILSTDPAAHLAGTALPELTAGIGISPVFKKFSKREKNK